MPGFKYITAFLFFPKRKTAVPICCSFFSLYLLFSCNNNHCNEPMYAPLVLSFYSEVDTARQVSPTFMVIAPAGSDSFTNVSGQSSIQLPLKKFDTTSSFRFETADQYSPSEDYRFVENRPNDQCPCSNSAGSVPVYADGEKEVFLCSEQGNALILYKDSASALYFLRGRDEVTLSVYKPTENILAAKYENNLEFISAECGCLATFDLKDIYFEKDGIGEAIITNPLVTGKYDEKHAKILLEDY